MKRNIELEWDPKRLQELPVSEVFCHLRGACFKTGSRPTLEDLNQALEEMGGLQSAGGAPIRFVPQAPRGEGFTSMYDVRIYETGEVQTRENWHDLFNALTWMLFPESKVRVNARHYEELHTHRERWADRGRRSDEEHLMCLVNESALVLTCSDPGLEELVRNFEWRRLFWERRGELPEGLGVFAFGHAVYEKLLTPYVGLTAHGIIINVNKSFHRAPVSEQLRELDEKLAFELRAAGPLGSIRDLCPFPLLGYPGFFPPNEDPGFYDNTDYFRPGRRSKKSRPEGGALS